MKTAVGAPDPGEFERNQPHKLFNDRRIGGKSKNRAVRESYVVTKAKYAAAPPPPPPPPKGPPKGPKKIKGYPQYPEHP